ncbi:MAG: GNAT family N-acetyltransferase [Bacteroidales bacterium]
MATQPFLLSDQLANDVIRLRAPEPSDLDILYLWENNPSTWKVSNTIVPVSKYILKQFIDNASKDLFEVHQLRLIIETTKEKKPVGTVELYDFDPFHLRAGIGILIGDLSERRKGYAENALRVLIAYVFDILCLHQIYCNIALSNESSLKLFTKAGFSIVGIRKEWNRNADGWEDEYFLQLINQKQIH